MKSRFRGGPGYPSGSVAHGPTIGPTIATTATSSSPPSLLLFFFFFLEERELNVGERGCLGCSLWQGDTLALVLGQQMQKQGVQGLTDRRVAQAAQMQVLIEAMVTYGTIQVHKARVDIQEVGLWVASQCCLDQLSHPLVFLSKWVRVLAPEKQA